MSISTFQSNLKNFLDNPQNTKSSEQFAQFLTLQYDTLIRSGIQSFTGAPIVSGNTSGMQNILKNVLNSTLNSTVSPTPIIQNMGPAFLTYWTGSQIIPGIPPIPPPPPAISNVTSIFNPVLNTGTWTVSTPQSPSNLTDPFVATMISTIQLHLTTISGIYFTISLYPPLSIPLPGIVPWVGYTVP